MDEQFKPKSIFLLSSGPRSGSTWLTEVLSRLDNTITSIEIFNPNLNKEISNIENNSKKRVQYVLEKIFLAKKNNKNFLFTSFFDHFNRIDILYILSMVSDVLIFNYRTNILHQWISYIKSYQTAEWQNKNLTDLKINWNEKDFLSFKEGCDKVFKIINILLKKNIKIPVLNYEDIHKFPTDVEKIEYINNKISKCGLIINDYSDVNLKKQNDFYHLNKCFNNFDTFNKFKNIESFTSEFKIT